jgi:iron complex outermembrane receptor protein
MLRSSFDLPHDTEVDVDIRHVATLPSPVIPAYTAVDLRVAWGVRPGLELSIVGENLFDPGHIEFGTPETTSEIPRTVFFKVSWTL